MDDRLSNYKYNNGKYTVKPNKFVRFFMSIFICMTVCVSVVHADLEEILVTATKRSENIQDVPISISAYSNYFLEESAVADIQELAVYVPNLDISRSGPAVNQRIGIRGVGSIGNNAIEPSVAVIIDGVYYPRAGSIVGDFQDVKSIEVLRGPQGTLFGRNASIGVLNIQTQEPSHNSSADLSLIIGNYNRHSASATFNGHLSDKLAGRLSVQHSDKDGYGKSTFDGSDIGAWEDSGVRAGLLFDVTDSVQAIFRVDWKEIKNSGIPIEVIGDSVLPRYLGSIGSILDSNFSDGIGNGPLPDIENDYDFMVNQAQGDFGLDKQWGISLDVKGELANHTWRSITATREWNNHTYENVIRLPADILPRDTRFEVDTFSQEFQLLSNTQDKFKYVAGLYYYHEEYKLSQDFDIGRDFCSPIVFNSTFFQALALGETQGDAGLLAENTARFCGSGVQDSAIETDFNHEVDSLAVFFQGTYDIRDDISVMAGVRYTDDSKDGFFQTKINNPIVGPAALILRAPEINDLTFDDSQLTWVSNVKWDVSDTVMAFLTVSTGFKSGGFNSEGTTKALGSKRIFDSEKVINYEFGAKSILLDNQLMLNATLYRTEIENFQDRLFDGISLLVVNAGKLRQQGLELDLNYQPNDNFTLIVGLGLLDSEFIDYANGTNLPGFDQSVTQNLTGTSNNFSADYQSSLIMQWKNKLSNGLNWFVRGEYNYVDEQSVSAQTDNNPASIQDAYGLINVRLGIADVKEKWDIALYGRNIAEQGYCQATFYQPLASTFGLIDSATGNALARCVSGAPRTYGVRLNYHF